MRIVKCYECGKHYNYDEDGFCSRCGAFNQPPPLARIAADGSIVRVDGLNEQGHVGSFLHKEYHEEERERRRSGLDKSVVRVPRAKAPAAPKAAPKAASAGRTLAAGNKRRADKGVGVVIAIVIWLLSLIFGFFL